MYIPRHWHWVAPVAVVLLGFYIGHNFKYGFDVFLTQGSLVFIACSHALYILKAGVLYQAYLTQVDTQAEARKAEPPKPRDIPNLNEAQTVYSQLAAGVRFDLERNLAVMLCVMNDHQMKVDLTEKKWVKPNKFKTREHFLEVLDRWKRRGIIDRVADRKNSPYEVKDWQAVRLIADGNPLPR